VRGDQQFPDPLFPDALASRPTRVTRHAQLARQSRARLAGAVRAHLGRRALVARGLGGAALLAEVPESYARDRRRRGWLLPVRDGAADRRGAGSDGGAAPAPAARALGVPLRGELEAGAEDALERGTHGLGEFRIPADRPVA